MLIQRLRFTVNASATHKNKLIQRKCDAVSPYYSHMCHPSYTNSTSRTYPHQSSKQHLILSFGIYPFSRSNSIIIIIFLADIIPPSLRSVTYRITLRRKKNPLAKRELTSNGTQRTIRHLILPATQALEASLQNQNRNQNRIGLSARLFVVALGGYDYGAGSD